MTSTSAQVVRTTSLSRSPSSVRGLWRPGVSTRISWASGRCTMPRTVCRVVCGRLEVIATFWPTRAFVRVDLPALGRPTKQAKPARWAASAAARMTGYERSWRPLSLIDRAPPHPARTVSFPKPSRNETSRKHTRTRPETHAGDPLTSPHLDGDDRDSRRRPCRRRIDTGDTAWLLAATALVLLMTPGLALFYGGMVRTKSVLNMLMMSFVSIALVTVVWLAAGYSLAFGTTPSAAHRRPRPPRHGRPRPRRRARHRPHPPLRHLPADLRGHHGRADQRRDRGPREVRGVAGLRAGVGAARIRSGRPLGVGAGRLDPRRPRRPRLRGRPAGRGHVGRLRTGVVPGPRPAARLQERRHAPAQPADGHARRGPAVVRLVRLQRRFRPRRQRPGRRRVPQHPHRRLPRPARLALRRAEARRPPDDTRRGLRRGRRSRRHHPVLRLGLAARRAGHRPRRRCRLQLCRGLEVQARLRRLARRRRRPPGRRRRRYGPDRRLRGRVDDRRGRGPALRRRARPARQADGGRGRRRSVRLPRHVRHREADRQGAGLPRGRGARAHRSRPYGARRDGIRSRRPGHGAPVSASVSSPSSPSRRQKAKA